MAKVDGKQKCLAMGTQGGGQSKYVMLRITGDPPKLVQDKFNHTINPKPKWRPAA